MDTSRVVGLCVMALVVLLGAGEAALTPHFYDNSCPQIYSIVKSEIQKAVAKEARNAASLVRLHFHDCFVNGCDGSLLLDNTTEFVSEKNARANLNSARGFEIIDAIKAALEDACPRTVSCADILAIASRDSAVEAGLVPEYPVFFGRRDSVTKPSIDAANKFLPSPNFTYTELKKNFENVGLNELDLVALSGAHTIGRVRCALIRAFSLKDNLQTNTGFRDFLNTTICPKGTEVPRPDGSLVLTDLDLRTPDIFDTSYYRNLRRGEGMIPSDQTLQDTRGVNQAFVANFALDRRSFFRQFAVSTIKMGNIRPLEGKDGEIRLDCKRRNPKDHSVLIASQ
jgi:peroxidase